MISRHRTRAVGYTALAIAGAFSISMLSKSRPDRVRADNNTPITSAVQSVTIPDLDTPSARLWDFAAASDRLYFLVADRKASTYELCISDAKGNLEQRISLPTKEGYASGKVRVSRRGVVAVLFRGHGNSEVTVLAKEGNLISDTNLDKYILEIAFTGDKLVGASWEGLVSLNQFLGESMGESLSITRELSYPFALLPLPSGSLGVFDYLGGTFLSISNGAVDNARVFQIPELLERPKELAAEGAALVIDSTVDDTGNYYLALPNFKPSMYARVLKLDSRAQRVGVMQFPMAHHPDTGRYVHPRLIRVDSGKVFIACLRSNQLLVCSF